MHPIFKNIAKHIIKTRRIYGLVFHRRFKANFGVSLPVCRELWKIIPAEVNINLQKQFLLWTLFFLKAYPTDNVMHTVLNADEKTLRKWIKRTALVLSKLKMVCYE